MRHIFDDPEYDDEEEETRYGMAGWIFLAGLVLLGIVIVVLCR